MNFAAAVVGVSTYPLRFEQKVAHPELRPERAMECFKKYIKENMLLVITGSTSSLL